ncbi:N/A [soil metagenome]
MTTRVLFVDHAAVLGGAQLCLLDIAAAFRERCAVALFEAGPFQAALRGAGVQVIDIDTGDSLKTVKKDSSRLGGTALLGMARASIRVARAARDFDIIYANSAKSFLASALAGLIARRPVVWHLHDILDGDHFSGRNLRVVVRAANWRAARVVANSQATADAFVAVGGRRDLVRVVYNGIDAAPFDALGPDVRDEVRHTLGVPRDAFVVGSFSRLHPWKGQRILLDALTSLPDVQALIVGGALFSGEAGYRTEIQARAAEFGGRVRVLGARPDIPRLMKACDVVVHTSILPEPFGRVLVEALLAGRPLIATNAGGVREIAINDVTALLVPPGDAACMANAIDALRAHPARARALAAAGNADMRVRFNLEQMIEGVEHVLDEVVVKKA